MVLLEDLTSLCLAPVFIRSDNCPEFVATTLRHWFKSNGSTTASIKPCYPRHNDFAESFSSLFRDEFPNIEPLATVAAAQSFSNHWSTQKYYPQAPFCSPVGYASGVSSSRCCITTHLHCAWSIEGGHATFIISLSFWQIANAFPLLFMLVSHMLIFKFNF